jgi:hypothetical protein
MGLLVGGFGWQFAVTNPLIATRIFHLGSAGFGLFGTCAAVGGIGANYWSSHREDPAPREFAAWAAVFAVAAIASTAGVRWALIGPGLVIAACAAALLAGGRRLALAPAAALAARVVPSRRGDASSAARAQASQASLTGRFAADQGSHGGPSGRTRLTRVADVPTSTPRKSQSSPVTIRGTHFVR